MTGAVIYARYSSEHQTEQSIEGQLHKCYEYAKANNLTKKSPESMIRILIKKIVVYDDKIEIFYNFTSKNPDDDGRDFTLLKGSDSSPMVEVRRVKLLCCVKTKRPSTYLVSV